MKFTLTILLQLSLLVIIFHYFSDRCVAQYSFEIVIDGGDSSTSGIGNMIEASDGYFVGTYSLQQYSGTPNTWDEHIISISPIGDTATHLFQKQDAIMYFTKLIQVREDPIQYFASGMNYASGTSSKTRNEFFMLLDENFGIIWEKQYKLSQWESGGGASNDVIRLVDGSYLYAANPQNYYGMYLYLFHLSADGDSLDYRFYEGDSAGLNVMTITYSPDSTAFWLHTYYAHFDPTGPASQVIVLNDQLVQTEVMYYPRFLGENYYAKVLPDNKLVVGGYYYSPSFRNNGINYLSSFIVDTGLNVLYEDYITDPDTALATTGKCVDYYYPDQVFVGGTHNRSLWGEFPTWFVLAKYNSELDLIYERYIGDSANYWLYDIVATSDSGVLLSGRRYDYWEPVPKRKGVIIKLNSDGILVGKEEISSGIKISKAIIYPNPGTAKLMVRTALKNCIIRLFDIKGTEVMAEPIDKHITEINTRKLKPGAYIFVIEQNNTAIETGKWIKQ